MGSVNRMDQNVAKNSIGIQMKKWWWSPFVSMIDGAIQGVRVLYHINKDEDNESPPLLAFRRDAVNAIFMKYLKEGRLPSSQVEIRNIQSDVCCDDTKQHQVQSEHRRIQNPFKHLSWSVIA